MASPGDTHEHQEPQPTPPPWHRVITAIVGPLTWVNASSWIKVIGVILLLKSCIIDQYTIPSGSMEPTLHGVPGYLKGDHVLVNKWIFGPRVPFTTWRLAKWNEPKRWDIVVFRSIEESGNHKTLIKRVAGLPGEHVRIGGGKLYVNGEPAEVPEELKDIINYSTSIAYSEERIKTNFLTLAQRNEPIPLLDPRNDLAKQFYADMDRVHPQLENVVIDRLDPEEIERLCAGVAPESLATLKALGALSLEPMRYGIREDPEYAVVPDGHYFLLGDNSANSRDGRVWGWVPHNHLLGRASAIIWPWPRRRDFTGFTRTWWGRLLLYGIPAALVGYEVLQHRRERRRPASRKEPKAGNRASK